MTVIRYFINVSRQSWVKTALVVSYFVFINFVACCILKQNGFCFSLNAKKKSYELVYDKFMKYKVQESNIR